MTSKKIRAHDLIIDCNKYAKWNSLNNELTKEFYTNLPKVLSLHDCLANDWFCANRMALALLLDKTELPAHVTGVLLKTIVVIFHDYVSNHVISLDDVPSSIRSQLSDLQWKDDVHDVYPQNA